MNGIDITAKRFLYSAILSYFAFMNSVAAAPLRPNATETLVAPSMNRYYSFINTFGGNSTTDAPVNWGMMVYNLVGIYPDAIGQIAYVILFAIPFIMMWIVQADMTLPAIIGMLFSFYVFLKLPEQYILFGVGCFAISITSLLWSLLKRY